jgi:hypothetical protein
MEAFDQQGESARAAADFEHAMTGPKIGDLDQRLPGRMPTEEFYSRVVKGQRPVASRRWNVHSSSV